MSASKLARPAPSPEYEAQDAGRQLARHVAEFDSHRLPAEVVEVTKLSILDTLGVTFAASGLASSAPALRELAEEAGGKPESTLLGYGTKVPAHMAAFANGGLAHCLDYDDLNHDIALHPSTSTVPSSLALAEALGSVRGIDLVTAVALGNDLATRLGWSITWKHDWFTTPLFGFFTAAAVSSRILGLDAERTFNAMGIAFAQAGGTLEMRYSTGSEIAGIYAAWPNKAGVIAARLAASGIGGIDGMLEGTRGLYAVYFNGEFERQQLTDQLGLTFRGLEVSFKPWPSCGLTHSPIDGVLTIMHEEGLSPDDVDEITYTTGNPNAWALCEPLDERRHPTTGMDARFSIPYTMATAAARDSVKLDAFTPDGLVAEDVAALADRVRPIFDETWFSSDPIPPIKVGILTRAGAIHTRRVTESYGRFPTRPMDAASIAEKFRDCMSYSATPMPAAQIEQIIDAVLHLDELSDTTRLHSALNPGAAEVR